MSRRRRVFVEHASFAELASPRTLERLRRYRLEAIVALPPGRETPDWAAALRVLSKDLLGVGLWPLLADEDGYWLHAGSLETATRRVMEAVAFARSHRIRVRTWCFDVEPALDVMRGLKSGGASGWLRALKARPTRADHTTARRRLQKMVTADLDAETYLVLPPVPFLGHEVDRLLGIVRAGAHVEALMTYSSLARPWLGSGRMLERWLGWTARRHRRGLRGRRPALALGCTGTGKLGDETVYASPGELRRDVEIARRAGIDDLALFSWEGTLSRANPDAWLTAFCA